MPVTLPRLWPLRTVSLLNAMAEMGTFCPGQEDPDVLMTELADWMGTRQTDDPWLAVIARLEEREWVYSDATPP